ncbi:MAG: hypothetical protein IPH78_09110 [Bacteroidetes bacterium]|nr:hypothetical protein [Bacteroidota bacterium]
MILSDILQSGRSEMDLYEEVASIIQQNEIHRLSASALPCAAKKSV